MELTASDVRRRRGAHARHAAHAGPAMGRRHVQLGPGRKSVSRMQTVSRVCVGKRVDEMSVSL
eukprot:1368017-Prymnesium_polylepis.1